MEAFWDETIDRACDRIPAGAAEHLFGSGVEHNYSVFVIDGNDRIHRRLDNAVQMQLASASLSNSLFPFRSL